MGDWNSTVPTFAAGSKDRGVDNQTLADIATALTAAWTTYTPTWASSGSAPAYGTSTVTARYRRLGHTVDVLIYVLFNGATFGTGTYTFSLPSAGTPVAEAAGSGWAFDVSATARNRGTSRILVAGTIEPHFSDGTTGQMAATSPWTWANGDWILIQATYDVT